MNISVSLGTIEGNLSIDAASSTASIVDAQGNTYNQPFIDDTADGSGLQAAANDCAAGTLAVSYGNQVNGKTVPPSLLFKSAGGVFYGHAVLPPTHSISFSTQILVDGLPSGSASGSGSF